MKFPDNSYLCHTRSYEFSDIHLQILEIRIDFLALNYQP